MAQSVYAGVTMGLHGRAGSNCSSKRFAFGYSASSPLRVVCVDRGGKWPICRGCAVMWQTFFWRDVREWGPRQHVSECIPGLKRGAVIRGPWSLTRHRIKCPRAGPIQLHCGSTMARSCDTSSGWPCVRRCASSVHTTPCASGFAKMFSVHTCESARAAP